MPLKIGDSAPLFSLYGTDRKLWSLGEHLSKRTVIAIIPGAFTSVCTEEICTFRDSYTDFETLNAQVVILAVDSPFVNKAYADAHQIPFPILSDYSRQTVSLFGGVHENFAGFAGYSAPKRSVFIIDQHGTVTYAWITENPGELPPFAELKAALRNGA